MRHFGTQGFQTKMENNPTNPPSARRKNDEMMDTEKPETSNPKRIRVDADDSTKEVAEQRRGKIELNKEQRDNIIRWILACHIHITAKITSANDINDKVFKSVHVSEQVTSIFITIHTCLRQESLSSGSLRRTMEDKNHVIQIEGNDVGMMQHADGIEIVQQIAKDFGLIYERPAREDTNHWYGTAAPIISFLHMFKVRLAELRVGHGTFTTQKDANATRVTSSSYYGFYSVHHPLLEGISIPPEKKSGMAQSLGPLTSLICLARSDSDPKYSKRWRAAVKRDLSLIPEIDSIIEVCCGKPAQEVKGLFTLIADIILITTSREAKRASFPACMLYSILDCPEKQHYVKNKTKFTNATDISWFNFSGIGAAYLYKNVSAKEWICPIQDNGIAFLPEIIFHSIWGTFGTDFGLLEYMTGFMGWATRNRMGDCFLRMGTGSEKTFKMIPLLKFSKMSAANQTGLLSLSSNPIVGKSAFSGYHKQVFTDEFIEYLDSSKGSSTGVTKNVETLKNLLMQTRENLRDTIAANGIQDRGTTKWHSMDDCTKETYGKELDERPTVKGQLYMQGNK